MESGKSEDIFEISKLMNGATVVKLLADKFVTHAGCCVQQQLASALSEVKGASILDVTSLEHHSIDLDHLAPALLGFLLNSSGYDASMKRKIIGHENQCTELRGKINGVFLNEIKGVMGDVISLPSYNGSVNVKVRDIFNKNYFSSFIVSPKQTKGVEIIKSHLEELRSVEASEITYDDKRSIIIACKKIISKLKRSAADQDNLKRSTESSSEEEPGKDLKKESEKPSPSTSKNEKNSTKGRRSLKAKKCYICKQLYSLPNKKKRNETWNTYPRLCKSCGELNTKKRQQKADLKGKIAVVTGGRIKIGFELVLKMLRDGCTVITTTRFPHDAAKRYAQESDFEEWKDRLHIYALDLKDIPGVYKFITYVKGKFAHLDMLVNNAAQTIRRPMDFFRHLMDYECIPRDHIPDKQRQVLVEQEVLNYGYDRQRLPEPSVAAPSLPTVVEIPNDEDWDEPATKRPRNDDENTTLQPSTETQQDSQSNLNTTENKLNSNSDAKLKRSVSLDSRQTNSMGRNIEPDASSSTSTTSFNSTSSTFPQDVVIHTGSAFSSMSRYFPRGATDTDGQQLDLRRKNSWRAVLDNVPVTEMVEILVVNVIAPFLLNKELKAMLCKSPAQRKFIVNVSAMEGQFNRCSKTKFHPHTNMGKAALNMMTRTAALGYKQTDIYMTSVDTGWVTDERPFFMARHEQRKKGFQLPLDNVDGAARIYDPIVMGLADTTTTPHYAVFLKDYAVYPW